MHDHGGPDPQMKRIYQVQELDHDKNASLYKGKGWRLRLLQRFTINE